MKWFQHLTDAHTSKKLRQLLRRYGIRGYGLYWLCLELVGKDGTNYRLKPANDWKISLFEISKENNEAYVEQVLNYMAEIKLINAISLERMELYVPKLKERLDNWTKWKQTKGYEASTKALSTYNISTIQYNKIKNKYIALKNYPPKSLTEDDYKRIKHGTKALYFRAKEELSVVLNALDWISRQSYEWTLETLLRKWPDYLKSKEIKEIEAKPYDISGIKKVKEQVESEQNPENVKKVQGMIGDLGKKLNANR